VESITPFLRMIADHQDDDGPLLVLADWLDEQGDPAGDGLRWVVSLNRRPHRKDSYSYFFVTVLNILGEIAAGKAVQCFLPPEFLLPEENVYSDRMVVAEDVVGVWIKFMDRWRKVITPEKREKLLSMMPPSKEKI
jgi:uncharacterized protein (TIGR02996 family)